MLTTELAFLRVALRFPNGCIDKSHCMEPRNESSDDPVAATLFIPGMCRWRQSH